MARDKWFVLNGFRERLNDLTRQGVMAMEIEVTIPRGIRGISFPATDKDAVFRICGIDPTTPYTEHSTEIGNIYYLNLTAPPRPRPTPPPRPADVVFPNRPPVATRPERRPTPTPPAAAPANYNVVFENNNYLEAKALIEPVLQEFANTLMLDLYVSNPHGEVSAPRNDPDRLYIRFYSAPVATNFDQIDTAFGINLDVEQDNALAPSGQGVPIRAPRGRVVAELVSGTLYILFDLPDGRNADRLLREIMGRLPRELQITRTRPTPPRPAAAPTRPQPNRPQPAEEAPHPAVMTAEQERSRQQYIQECRRRMGSELTNAKSELNRNLIEQNTCRESLVQLIQAEPALQRKAEAMTTFDTEARVAFADEYDKLMANEKIERVAVRNNVITIITQPLITAPLSDGTCRNLGIYKIDIFLNGRTMQIANLTQQIRYNGQILHHPFIVNGTVPYFGELTEAVIKLVGQYQYAILIEMLIRFLETINEESPYGQYVFQFPIAEIPEAEEAAPDPAPVATAN